MAVLLRFNLLQVFGMCLMVVLVLFVGYEVAERTWLQHANPGLQHLLHLALGVSAAALTATMATYVMLCQFEECSAEPEITGAPVGWLARLQHTSLRTKLIVPMIALAVLPGIGIGVYALLQLRALVQDGAGSAEVITEMRVFLIQAMVLVLGVAATTGALIAHYVTRPVAAFRAATRDIAAGDLSHQVKIRTGDEIQGLSEDFNTMTVKLAEARRQLALWNAGLQEEVDRQTSQLRDLQAGLARVDRLSCVGQMTASIMHEIGNPLAAIKTKIQVAQERGGGVGTVLDDVLHEVDRLGGVLRSYSRFNRLHPTAMEPADLRAVVEGVAVLIAPELRRRGVTLETALPKTVPGIRGDADRLRQLFINFILNAAEAMPHGGPITIAVEPLDAVNKRVVVAVADGGTGIPDAVLANIWTPFFTTKESGTGLGLAICRQIIDDHEGTVTVENQPGGGTRIRVEFPALHGDPVAGVAPGGGRA